MVISCIFPSNRGDTTIFMALGNLSEMRANLPQDPPLLNPLDVQVSCNPWAIWLLTTGARFCCQSLVKETILYRHGEFLPEWLRIVSVDVFNQNFRPVNIVLERASVSSWILLNYTFSIPAQKYARSVNLGSQPEAQQINTSFYCPGEESDNILTSMGVINDECKSSKIFKKIDSFLVKKLIAF